MFLEGKMPSKISKDVKIPLSSLLYRLEKEGLYKRKRNKMFSLEQIQEIIVLRQKGYATERIAKELNLPLSRMVEFIKEELLETKAIKKINRSTSKRVKYSLNVHFFDEINSQEKAYWLGFLFADGSLHKNKLTIRLSKEDKNHLYRFIASIEFTGEPEDVQVDTNFKKNAEISHLQINSTELARALNKYMPFGKKSDKLIFPQWLDQKLIWDFIRGYFDGDGFVISTRKKIGFCGNPVFLQHLRETFISFCIASEKDGYFQHKKDHYAELVFGVRVSRNIAKMMYENDNISLERKKNDLYFNHSGCKTP